MARAGTRDPRKHLRRFLEALSLCWSEEQAKQLGVVYRGPADFVLKHGDWYEPRPRPSEVQPGAPRQCFGNAIQAGVFYGLEYVEGYAVDPGRIGLVVHHAWNCDAEGRLIDVTWSPPATAYLGVRFSVERADDCTWNGDASVLDDFIRRWPLLRQPWVGEPADMDWPPSERLDAIRALARGDRRPLQALLPELGR